ncbi:MAG: DUF86 domain-containing protein [Acidobacteria bacterium]|nr:DUF86 domain-containing protein [Acidobacteriota bacterium]
MRDDRQRLMDILEAIERVERYASEGQERFEQDELIQTWIVHHLVIIGEACRALSKDFRAQNPHDAWVQAAGMRNVIVHEYFGVDVEIVWIVVDRDLPILKAHVVHLLG